MTDSPKPIHQTASNFSSQEDTHRQSNRGASNAPPAEIASATVPSPSLSNLFLASPPDVLPPKSLRMFVANLEQRLKKCEQFVGPPCTSQILQPSDAAKDEAKDGAESPFPATTVSVTDQARRDAWIKDIEKAVSYKHPMSVQVEQLQLLSGSLFQGKIAEIERKVEALQSVIQADNASLSQIMLSLQAKKEAVLQNEGRIRDTTLLLRQLDEMKDYINPSSFSALLSHAPRIEALEMSQIVLAERGKKLYCDLEEIALNYNSAMNLLWSALSFGGDALTGEPKQQRKAQ